MSSTENATDYEVVEFLVQILTSIGIEHHYRGDSVPANVSLDEIERLLEVGAITRKAPK